MRFTRVELYVHLVWATWNRAPLITADIEQRLYAVMHQRAVAQRVRVIAIGGVQDHVHMLVRVPATAVLSEVVGQIKGASSHFATQVLGRPFRWQGGYAAFSVSRTAVPRVRDYVLNQKERHARAPALHNRPRDG
jgi:putative transposase